MARKPINSDLVGHEFSSQEMDYGPGQAVLFAISLGLRHQQPDDARFLLERGGGHGAGLQLMPNFPTTVGYRGAQDLYNQVEIPGAPLHLHERLVSTGRAIPPAGQIVGTRKVTAVRRYEREGKLGVLLTISVDCANADGGLCTADTTLLFKGEPAAGVEAAPDYYAAHLIEKGRTPDYAEFVHVGDNLAALFARAGADFNGDTNPMHRDESFGSPTPFIQGRLTLGMVYRAAIRARGRNRPESFRSYEGIFAGKVRAGDRLVIMFFDEGPTSMLVHVRKVGVDGPEGVVISNARIEMYPV